MLSTPENWVRLLAYPAMSLAAMNLSIGWLGGAEFFVRGLSDFPGMIPGTAICILLLGLSQVMLVARRPRVRRWGAALVAVTCLVAIGAYSVFGAATDQGQDQMSVATLLAVVLIALAQIGAAESDGRSWHVYVGGLVMLIAVVALIGYLLSASALLSLALFRGLSVLTSVSVLILAVAAMLNHPGRTWFSILIDPGEGGRMVRRYLPWAFVLPVVVGQLAYVLTELELLDSAQRLLAFTSLIVVLSSGSVIAMAHLHATSERRDLGSRENLRAILSGLHAAIFVLGRQGDILGRNRVAEQLLGKRVDTVEDLSRLTFHTMPEREELKGADHPVAQILSDPQDMVAGWIDASGDERVLRFSSFETGQTATTFRIIVIEDVTEPWMLQQTVAQSERADALAQLVSGISHEMLNVFGVINLAAGSVKSEEPDAVRAISKASARGGDLAERLQRLTAVHNGAVKIVDLGDSIRSAIELARRALPDGIVLDQSLEGADVPVTCEASELELAILNLILNARNAIQDADQLEGEIRVTLRTEETQVVIEVADNGPGIPTALVERVQEPFFTTRRDRGGTGLGLATVADFAAKNGGSFELVERDVGGTIARVRLPISTDATGAEPSGDLPQALRGLSIVVADGDPDFLTILSDTLILLGARVHRADTGAAALEALQGDPGIQLLMTDHVLTGPIAGAELAVRARSLNPEIAVIYMSGALRGTAPVQTEVAGMTLGKPMNMSHLSNAVLRALGRPQAGAAGL